MARKADTSYLALQLQEAVIEYKDIPRDTHKILELALELSRFRGPKDPFKATDIRELARIARASLKEKGYAWRSRFEAILHPYGLASSWLGPPERQRKDAAKARRDSREFDKNGPYSIIDLKTGKIRRLTKKQRKEYVESMRPYRERTRACAREAGITGNKHVTILRLWALRPYILRLRLSNGRTVMRDLSECLAKRREPPMTLSYFKKVRQRWGNAVWPDGEHMNATQLACGEYGGPTMSEPKALKPRLTQEGSLLDSPHPLFPCTRCQCKDFNYDSGEHPGVCNCRHSDTDHVTTLPTTRTKENE